MIFILLGFSYRLQNTVFGDFRLSKTLLEAEYCMKSGAASNIKEKQVLSDSPQLNHELEIHGRHHSPQHTGQKS